MSRRFLVLTAVVALLLHKSSTFSGQYCPNELKNCDKDFEKLQQLSDLNNDFETGSLNGWIDDSKTGVRWKIEDLNSPWELNNNNAPKPLNGKNYMRVDRGSTLSFGVAILRSPTFKISLTSNNYFSFDFWIRSKWPQFTNLELYLNENGNEKLLLSLFNYSDITKQNWSTSPDIYLRSESAFSEFSLVFYGYCGTDAEDAIAIDNIRLVNWDLTTIDLTESTKDVTDVTTPSFYTETTTSVDCPQDVQGNLFVPCKRVLKDKCYCYSSGVQRWSWTEADAFCKGGGMNLVRLETEENNQLIRRYSPGDNFMFYWTSGRYSQEGNNRWEWTATKPIQPFTYTNWYAGEPSSNDPGHCMFTDMDINGYWKATPCSVENRLVCESTI